MGFFGYLNVFLLFGIALILVSLGAVVAMYGMRAYGLYTMARNRRVAGAWIAWIPLLSNYLSGTMTKEMTINGYRIKKLALLNVVIPILGCICIGVPIFGQLIFLSSLVFVGIVHYHFFCQYCYDTGICVIYALFPFVGFFRLRDEKITAYPSV